MSINPVITMKTTWFTITPDNAITAFANEQEARDSDCRYAFADEHSLATILDENVGESDQPSLAVQILSMMPLSEPVNGWSCLTPAKASKTIWKSIQTLADAVHTPAKPVKAARVRAQAPLAAAKAPKGKKNATATKRAPKGKKKAKTTERSRRVSKLAKPTPIAKKERAAKTTKPAVAAKTPGVFRDGSKASQVVELLKRPGGATLKQIMTKFDWLPHTTRALLSAGGSLAKHGIVVISEKPEEGDRTYRIAS